MPEPPLLQYKIVPGPSYYKAMTFLGNIPRAVQPVAKSELNEAASEIVKLARQNVNTRTGNLESTIRVEIKGDQILIRAGGKEGSGNPPKYVNYAAWVEYGHAGEKPAPPHPYMMPAIVQVLGGGKPQQKILRGIIERANTRAFAMAPVSQGLGLTGLLGLAAVGMTAMAGVYAGIT